METVNWEHGFINVVSSKSIPVLIATANVAAIITPIGTVNVTTIATLNVTATATAITTVIITARIAAAVALLSPLAGPGERQRQ